ncbi:efflux RND transporter permease subunit [Neobacillus notoginsengisoli]|uniref:Efflux RND transporter permease subunit n=1 Tax=Neobacillus notoginsengisoli TaxID=1578198 RepID=A0A417YSK9_9BACI|nr:efflux RND transporter permease subunit [Neobacillus notoginsengisoli]RHW38967.1 efflux RND transporter permease subunit [Neobacillus notoginsengisoli]
MKKVIQFSMRNGVALFLMMGLILAGGIFSLKEINVEKYPNVDIPYLTVVIPYPGASPEQVMKEIGEPVERELMNLEGVKNIYTDAAANVFYSTMEIDMAVDMKDAEQLAKAAVDKIALPDTAKKPEFILQGPEPDPTIFAIGAYAGDGHADVQKVVKERLIPRLEMIDGVSKVLTGGIDEKSVNIRLLPEEMKKRGITLDQVKTAISANHMAIPTGDIDLSGNTLPVRVSKELTSLEDVKEVTLFVPGAQALEQVKLGEVADISYDSESKSDFTRINGKEGVRVGIVAEGGANVVSIVEKAREEMKKAELPASVKMEVLRDQSIEIKDSVYAMLREALLGSLMAVIVTFLFLRNIRSTLIAIISIPLSIFASFTVLNMLGYTLNIMTLAGIAVAVGRVVDDSIVVIENVFRRVRASKERNDGLVEEATREVAKAITSSTITTVAVFLPMAFVPGVIGKFFAPLAWTIVISLLFSLIVAITVVPLMSKMFLLKLTPREYKEGLIQRVYRSTLSWVLSRRALTLIVSIAVLAGTVALIAPKLGTTFLPQERVTNFDVNITMEKGASAEKTSEAASVVEDILLAKEEVKLVSTSVNGQFRNASIMFEIKNSVEDADQFLKDLRAQFSRLSVAKEISVTGIGGLAGGGQSQYTLVVNGSNFEDIKSASKEIVKELKGIDGMADVQSSLEGDEPEIQIDLDEKKLAENGLMPAMVGKSLRELINGDVVTTMSMEDTKTDVRLGLKMNEISSLDDLGEQQITNMMGMPVKLKEIGTLKRASNRMVITHLNQNEYVMVFAQITDSKTGDIAKKADEAIAGLDLPGSVHYYKEGASAMMEEGFKNMALAIGVSILLVYLVMVIAFGEGKAPFVILFSIPFSLIGALVGLYIVKEPIGMPAMIGLLMLNGIVVTNAIVLVDKVKQFEKQGLVAREALLEAGVIRIRPILMTAIATVGALLPMAISSHAGIVSSSMAVVVIGGLATSTLLTLFIVPVLYSLFHPKPKTQADESPAGEKATVEKPLKGIIITSKPV